MAKTLEAEEIPPGDKRLPARLAEAGGGGVRILGQYNLDENDIIARQEFARVVFFGDVQEWSVGFFVLDTDPENSSVITDIDWVEWSSVVAGAFPYTETIATRSLDRLLRDETEGVLHRLYHLGLEGVPVEVCERWLGLLDRNVADRMDEVEALVKSRVYGPELVALLQGLAQIVRLGPAEKAAIPSHSTPVVDEEWDGPEMVARCPAEREALRALHAWVDSEADPDLKGSYKLPHHMVSESGDVGAANIRGVRAALAALAGARGGVDIPEGDVEGVRAHLERHVRDFEAERARKVAALRRQILLADCSAAPPARVAM